MSVSLLLFTTTCESPASEVGQRKSGRAMWFINKKRKANTLEMIQWCRKKNSHLQTNARTYKSIQQCCKYKVNIFKKGMSIVNS